ncbi:MAG: diguanylate cyclase [Candidatus Zixiibacteriota bacterium]
MSLDFHISQFYRHQPVSFHYFESFEQLQVICRRFSISAIVIGGRGDFLKEIDLVRGIKQNVFLSIVPIILFHPDPPMSTVVAAFENGAEEFIYGEWIDRLVEVRLRRVIERNRRDMAVNPSTMLPGTAIIEQELTHQMSLRNTFAACYADLDNFKAFNDYYGYYRGDRVVKLTARIIKDVVYDLCPEGFVGHIAGDDFMFIIPSEMIDPVCSGIIRCFDTLIPYRYELEDRERGFITTVNRRGTVENFPILTISIAVIINDNGKFTHVGELARMLADLKKATKQKPGSNYMIERRAKY